MATPVAVHVPGPGVDVSAFAMPKSVSTVRPRLPSSRMLSGLTSRWMIPSAWPAPRASAVSIMMRRGFFGWQSLGALETRRDRFTVHVSHDEIDERVGSLTDRVNRHDVRMRETRGGFGFTQKAYADFFPERQLGRQHLHRDAPLQPLVARMVHDPHAPSPDFTLERKRGPEGLTQALRQRIVHADSESISGLRFSRYPAGLQPLLARRLGRRAPVWRRFVERCCRERRFLMAWSVHSGAR